MNILTLTGMNEVNDEPNDAGEGDEAYNLTKYEEWVGEKDAGGESESSSDGEFIIMGANEDDRDEGLSDYQSGDEPDPYSSGEEQDVEAINVERYMRGDLF